MVDRRLKEALELLGGRAVLKDGDDCYIVFTLKEFRKLRQEGVSGLTKQELIDKINNDIAGWKFSQEEDKSKEIELEALGGEGDEQIRYEKVSQL